MIQRMIVCEDVSGCEPEGDAVGKGRTYSHDEGVAETRDGVGDLVAELDVVVVEPAAGNVCDAVEAGDALLREEAGEDVADHTANSVRRKDLRGIQVSQQLGEPGWGYVHRGSHHSRI